MATTVSELQVVVSADTSKAESGLSSLGSKLGTVGAGLATAFGGAAIAGIAAVGGGLTAATVAAAGFDQTMASIRSKLSTKEWDDQGAALQNTAMRLGKDYPLSASEAGKAIDLLIQKGVSAKNINEGWAESVVKLSSATGSDLVTASGIAAAASDAFNIKADQSEAVVNKITGAVIKGGMSIEDFGYGFQSAGAVVALAGGSIDDVTLGLAAMARRGIEGSDAGTSLKTMYMNLIPTTKEQIKVAKELGIITKDGTNRFFDATGKAKDYAAISKVLAEATDGLTKKQQLMALETLFGSDAIRAAGISAEFGRGEIDELKASIDAVDAGEVAKKRIDNLKGSLEQFWGTVETAGIKLGQQLLPGLKELVEWGTDGLDDLTPTIEAVGASIGTALADGVKQAKDTLRQLGDAYRTVKQVFAEGWEPAAEIEPLALAAGNAATEVKKLRDMLQQASDKAGQMGAWDNFASGLETLKTEAQLVRDNLDRIGEALGRLDSASGGAGTKVNVLAAGIKVVGVAFELWAVSLGQIIDTFLHFGRIMAEGAALTLNMGKLLYGLATGDMSLAESAAKDAAKGIVSMVEAQKEWNDRTAERAKQAYRAVAGSAQSEMPAMAAAVESNMSAASQAVGENSAGMQRFMEENGAGMAAAAQTAGQQVATGVETGMTDAAAAAATGAQQLAEAAETAGQGMAAGIEAAAPQMAAAAETGASQAVAAVEGQAGAASAAGSSVGDSIGSGMQTGILGWLGSVAAAGARLAAAAIEAARGPEGADAHSPSRKMQALGKDMRDGLELELSRAGLGAGLISEIQGLLAAAREYTPVAAQIAQVESRIKEIREQAQTAALFRAQEMITIDSEVLRLKREQVEADKALLPVRQDLARVSREVSDIERGTLQTRRDLITFSKTSAEQNIKINALEKEKIPLRAQELEIERQLLGLDPNSKRAKALKEEQDELRKKSALIDNTISQIRLQSREQELDIATVKEQQTVASAAARIRKEELEDQVRAQETAILAIKDQIEVLGAEQASFQANEAIIKQATDNEVAYRQRLIAVFTAEGKPLADRITAGLALVSQLEKEGKISKELADKLRDVAKEAGVGASATAGMGSAAATAAPQIDAAAKKAAEMAQQAKEMAQQTGKAGDEVNGLAKSLGKLPDWFKAKGAGVSSVLFPPGRAAGGDVSAGRTYLVGERGPELFTPSSSGYVTPNHLLPAAGDSRDGGVQTLRLDVAIGGKVAKQIVVQGYDLAVKQGWTPGGLTG